ncbi:MAG TPA: alpha/beta hydrolase [Pseudonocardiaceae bacterium]|jgi:alpha-beta hydrolase superfamily lysophospholipase|nr:alpha/beta hydrolase [Pseudonocardiaceae bacterium]
MTEHTEAEAATDVEGWQPDAALGGAFQARTLPLGADPFGEVVATLVRLPATVTPVRGALLLVHGFADYFFHAELATALAGLGFDVYAIDLRRYGRSLRPGQLPNFVTDMHVHFEELDDAVELIRAESAGRRLVVFGHSTGGLITALWAHARRTEGIIDGLVLNSPWLDLAEPWPTRVLGSPVIELVGRLKPTYVIRPALGTAYGEGLHRDYHGEWDYRFEWKPLEAVAVRAGWLAAVRRGHREVHRGLAISAPVLVMHSSRSLLHQTVWTEASMRADTVLDVDQIHRWAAKLAPEPDVVVIPDGMHDLFLSAKPVRAKALAEVTAWLDTHLPA